MALKRRSSSNRFQASIWPGFVDAMTGLLLVLMFVLTVFTVVQFVLRDTITGQASELDELGAEVERLGAALGLERTRGDELGAELDRARTRAEEQAERIAAQDSALDVARGQITDFEAQVAALLLARGEAEPSSLGMSLVDAVASRVGASRASERAMGRRKNLEKRRAERRFR